MSAGRLPSTGSTSCEDIPTGRTRRRCPRPSSSRSLACNISTYLSICVSLDLELTSPSLLCRLHKDTLRQWDILEKRLSEPGQNYIALRDRPTIADLSYLPFSMPYMFDLFSVNIEDWPGIQKWSHNMLSRSAVKAVLKRAPTLGHGPGSG